MAHPLQAASADRSSTALSIVMKQHKDGRELGSAEFAPKLLTKKALID